MLIPTTWGSRNWGSSGQGSPEGLAIGIED
jgi:hypothetical protein